MPTLFYTMFEFYILILCYLISYEHLLSFIDYNSLYLTFAFTLTFKYDSLLFPHQQTRSLQAHQVVLPQSFPTGKTEVLKGGLNFFIQVNQLVITRKPKMCNFLEYK
jgi:hypothetical protein